MGSTTISPTSPRTPTTASSTRRSKSSEEVHLAHVDAALKRIEEGTYGVCANCGKPIQPERLEAMPWVTLCIDCKRLAERR